MKRSVTYKKAGVDIEKANQLIKDIRKRIDSTRVKGSMDSIGGFGAFFDAGKRGVKNPLLVASTDGVGTKLKLAIESGVNGTVGIDLVAMSVNDCLCCGARPLFFLDYFATGKLDGKIWTSVINGIVEGCKQAECALIGGETAEMPGMYKDGDYDLAGFAVGIVDRKKALDGSKVRSGDVILGIQSSGLHSNGYSFVRKIFSKKELIKNIDIFLKPTIIYVKPVLEIMGKLNVKAAAHITGGGFYDNIHRVVPKDKRVFIEKGTWEIPQVFKMIIKKAEPDEKEMYRTFNMGIGMALVISKQDIKKAQAILKNKYGLKSWVIGGIKSGKWGVDLMEKGNGR
ncbi:MAG TPA: phosphoribosylformylglycinamidine cyclo-ligase [Candidatus Omnitrophota bacterium]|nr:phosphoribosylformylglycinamidine cyclo-ligase [Candidatus Omnitrophota bacterium]HPS19669.1 phosphoribosylformylglycinamidine cyclo-ligase [Candidatus Omnitrophota bacterium]